jgi:hypothetical protein
VTAPARPRLPIPDAEPTTEAEQLIDWLRAAGADPECLDRLDTAVEEMYEQLADLAKQTEEQAEWIEELETKNADLEERIDSARAALGDDDEWEPPELEEGRRSSLRTLRLPGDGARDRGPHRRRPGRVRPGAAPGGRLLVKCMDYVSSGRLVSGYSHVAGVGRDLGLELVRRVHSFLLVFAKPRSRRPTNTK